jgi:hypothetical protein
VHGANLEKGVWAVVMDALKNPEPLIARMREEKHHATDPNDLHSQIDDLERRQANLLDELKREGNPELRAMISVRLKAILQGIEWRKRAFRESRKRAI